MEVRRFLISILSWLNEVLYLDQTQHPIKADIQDVRIFKVGAKRQVRTTLCMNHREEILSIPLSSFLLSINIAANNPCIFNVIAVYCSSSHRLLRSLILVCLFVCLHSPLSTSSRALVRMLPATLMAWQM